MNKTLKNTAVFFGTSALLALCYPQVQSTVTIAQTSETTVSPKMVADIDFNGDEKVRQRKVSTEASSSKSTTVAANTKTIGASSAKSEAVTYSATAYALRGRTATGSNVRRGIIAADPRHLPLGTRVQLSAGNWSGTYLVADTGGVIKGRKIDVWVPSNSEARQFGRRKVTLTVLTKARSKK